MAILHPFKAWRPSPQDVKKISCPPYDVISTEEARQAAKGNPKSFLHIIRPEIDLPESTLFNDPSVYDKGAENLEKFKREGLLQQDEENALFVYQLGWEGETQTGIFGCVSVDEYDEEVILKHELTRPDKEDDRTRHITEQQAHAEPVMLTCKDECGIADMAKKIAQKQEPLFDFTATDGVSHRLWKVTDTQELVDAFGTLSHLYIADGHHRCKAASRAAHIEREKNDNPSGDEEFNYFPAVIFPMDEMRILAYNRLIFDVPDDFVDQLGKRFDLQSDTDPVPKEKGTLCIYIDSTWYKLSLPMQENASAAEGIDVARLQKFILEPMLGINDPRRDENITFVGGIRGTDALEQRVDSGQADLAISMYPTSIEELAEVSDQGLLMPPKSTWFEPKLRSGLLVHTF